MRSLRAAPLTTGAQFLAWRHANHTPALVRRWRGRWRRFWASVATMGEGPPPMRLMPGSACPKCLHRKLAKHCESPTCPWLRCPGCVSNMRPDLSEDQANPKGEQ